MKKPASVAIMVAIVSIIPIPRIQAKATPSLQDSLAAALDRPDSYIDRIPDYAAMKKLRVSSIENLLQSRGVNPLQKYAVLEQLWPPPLL